MGTAGKTAPKLIADFLQFDPTQLIANRSYLADHPSPEGEGAPLAPGPLSCRHEYAIKESQSVLPPVDSRPQQDTQYKIAVICRKCRIHADVCIAYPRATAPCPSTDSPLHHLQHQAERDEKSALRIRYNWQCSVEACRADVKIVYRQPQINPEDYQKLTKREHLQKRFDAILAADPARSVKIATPVTAMHTLYRYVKDVLDPAKEKKPLKANNKIFITAFGLHGQDCKGLLEKMGFVYRPETDMEEAVWTLPNPPTLKDRLRADGSTLREKLEDIEAEAIASMGKLSTADDVNPVPALEWRSANRELERVLGAQNYPTNMLARRGPGPNDLLPYYASLGVQPDFADSLLESAYDRQVLCDPSLEGYYLECLQRISEFRSTEPLQIKVATLESQDLISRRDLTAAYRALDVKRDDSDERILDLFGARQSNCGPQGQEDNRQNLYKIGTARHSQRLVKASKQELETYEDALSWLGNGASRDVENSWIQSIVAIKIEESASNLDIAKKAVSIIAKERNTHFFDDWMAGRPPQSAAMSVDEALRHLNIDANLNSLDQSMLPVLFDSARSDRPGEQTEKAIVAIQKALESSSSSRPPELWPVGLTSHGNTCYLNSLLQYYFSIKPLRDIVLGYDNYKLDTVIQSEKAERVGQRIIKNVEIKGGQRFADDLKYLFDRMIKDPRPHVLPEEALVCRAFLVEPTEAGNETEDGKANGLDTAMKDSTTVDAEDTQQSDASSTTMVGDDDVAMKDKDSPPTPPGSPAQKLVNDGKPEPTEPPPLPPRTVNTTKEDSLNVTTSKDEVSKVTTSKDEALRKAEANARQQQDVTEVHDGAMFRLRSGMVARGMDERGEQQDALRDIFEIGLKDFTIEGGVTTSKVESSSSILVAVPNESTDLYTLLDKFFDLHDIPLTKKESYKSIQTAPPLLQISIPRLDYDSQRGVTIKREDLVRLPDELYLDRYMDECNEQVLPRRKKCWGWRKQLNTWKKERDSLANMRMKSTAHKPDGPTALAETASVLNGLGDVSNDLEEIGIDGIDVEPDLPDDLCKEAVRAQARIEVLQAQIDKLEGQFGDQFVDMKSMKYHLAYVFIHRGGYASGHYWIYIRDFEKNSWRKYNDEEVTEITVEQFHGVTSTTAWENGTPSYAVYVRDSDIAYISPLCRAPEKLPEPEPWPDSTNAGVEMETIAEGGSGWDNERQVAANITW